MEVYGTLKENLVPATTVNKKQGRVPASERDNYGSALGQVEAPSGRQLMVITLSETGHSNKEIAEALSYSEQRVSQILNDPHPVYAAHRERVREQVTGTAVDVMMKFRMESMASVNTLVEVRDNTDAPFSERRLSAIAILDRAGYSPVRKQMNMNTEVPIQELNAAAERIENANAALLDQDRWSVKTIPSTQIEDHRIK